MIIVINLLFFTKNIKTDKKNQKKQKKLEITGMITATQFRSVLNT